MTPVQFNVLMGAVSILTACVAFGVANTCKSDLSQLVWQIVGAWHCFIAFRYTRDAGRMVKRMGD